MGVTTLGIPFPDGTDLVTDGPTAIEDLATFIDGLVAARIAKALVDAKGDLIVATAADTVDRLPLGPDGQVLTADSTQAKGMKWAALGGVSSPGLWDGTEPDLGGGMGSQGIDGLAANTCHYQRHRVKESRLAAGIQLIVNTSSGNLDVGIYADNAGVPGARLASSGSVACPAAGSLATVAFTAAVALTAGQIVWVAIGSTSATARFQGRGIDNSTRANLKRAQAAYPLPNPAVPAAATQSSWVNMGWLA